jgi:hypothetical protein
MIGGAVFYRSLEALPFAFGAIVTSALNVVKILMLERTVKKTLDMEDQNTGKNYVRLQYLFRYFITAVVLVIIGLIHTRSPIHFISIWGALFGVFTMQIAVIITRHTKLEEEDAV